MAERGGRHPGGSRAYQYIFGSGETGVSAFTTIATPLCYHLNLWVYASVNIGRENDRSAGVGELRGKLSEAVAAFDSSKARIRELDSRLQGLEDPTALQLQDVERKLARFEEAGYTAI